MIPVLMMVIMIRINLFTKERNALTRDRDRVLNASMPAPSCTDLHISQICQTKISEHDLNLEDIVKFKLSTCALFIMDAT